MKAELFIVFDQEEANFKNLHKIFSLAEFLENSDNL